MWDYRWFCRQDQRGPHDEGWPSNCPSRVRAQEWNCWHPAHVKFFTCCPKPGAFRPKPGGSCAKGAAFQSFPRPGTNVPRRGNDLFPPRAAPKSGALGVSKFIPARRRARNAAFVAATISMLPFPFSGFLRDASVYCVCQTKSYMTKADITRAPWNIRNLFDV